MINERKDKEEAIEELRTQMLESIYKLKKMKDQMVILKNQKDRCYLVTVGKKHLMFASLKNAEAELEKLKSKAKLRSFGSPEARARYIKNQEEKEARMNKAPAFYVDAGRITGFISSKMLFDYSIANYPNANYRYVDLKDESSSFLRDIYKGKFYRQTLFNVNKNTMEDLGYENFFYVDGTTDLETGVYTSGYVLEHKGEYIKKQAYSFDVELSGPRLSSKAAELQSAILAVIEAKRTGINKFCIVFDCMDIVGAKLKRSDKCKLSSSYYDWMERETKGMDIEFIKAKSHIGIEGNELVDQLVYKTNAEPIKIYKR